MCDSGQDSTDHTEQQEIAQEGLGQMNLTTLSHTFEKTSVLPT